MAHLGIMPYVDRFSQNFALARWSVSYLLVYTWHTLLHYPHGANAGCDLAGVAPVDVTNKTMQQSWRGESVQSHVITQAG